MARTRKSMQRTNVRAVTSCAVSVRQRRGLFQLCLEFRASPDRAFVHRLPSDGGQAQVFIGFPQRGDFAPQLRLGTDRDDYVHRSRYRRLGDATTARRQRNGVHRRGMRYHSRNARELNPTRNSSRMSVVSGGWMCEAGNNDQGRKHLVAVALHPLRSALADQERRNRCVGSVLDDHLSPRLRPA